MKLRTLSFRPIIGLALALATPPCAAASELSWDFIEVRYMSLENTESPNTVAGDGYGVVGSKSLSDRYYVFGVYEPVADLSVNSVSLGVGLTMWRVGVGLHLPVNDKLEGFGEISYESGEFDGPSPPAVDGYGVRLGLRGNFRDSFEGTAAIRYGVATQTVAINCPGPFCTYGFGFEDSIALVNLGGAFKFNDRFALTASYEYGDSTVWTFGGRFMF